VRLGRETLRTKVDSIEAFHRRIADKELALVWQSDVEPVLLHYMTAYEDLDRELSTANLERARAEVEVLAEWSEEAAEAAERAWQMCNDVGERSEARYEHEARAAGLDITRPVVEDDFDPAANEIERLRGVVGHHQALLKVFEDPHAALHLILNAEDEHAARRALAERFGITDDEAGTTLLNLGSVGMISKRRAIVDEYEETLARLEQLRS
jgi:hypothetical protein